MTFPHVITLSSSFPLQGMIMICVITLVNKWQTKLLLMDVITATFKSAYRDPRRPSRLLLFGNCGNSFEGFWRHRAYKNEAHEWRDNPDTKSTKTKQRKKTLIGFSQSYYGNYALGCEHHKFHSSPLYIGADLHLIINGYALPPPAPIYRSIAAAL